ncbi:MAG TPA: bifunctional serine/threonine-protein kinase/formylglycine-generating enzyme family protein [Kofleriaceae bacterium]
MVIGTNDPTRSLGASSTGRFEIAQPPKLVVGETLGRYQVRRLLGQGGMGQVYLARDVVLGRSVALKIVGGMHDTDRFLDEARAIARLNHPNIVQLYDFGVYRSGIYLALEYVDGITLRERVARGPLELDEILRHVRAVADALMHAHASAVYHCDLKPSNVMIGRDGRVRVVDFGLAKTADTDKHSAGGTPDWMAPEQWLGEPIGERVDSWSLGIVTAELLAGVHPLGETQESRRREAMDRDRVASWTCPRADVPAAIIELVTRSLEHVPNQRPSAADWKRVLDESVSGRGEALDEDGPYPGLAAFDEHHARFFFGREPEVDEFLERLREATVLPIVGPSGAGKSSFLHAGVIPRLRARERWTVIALRPGADPIGTLARHVIAAANERAADIDHKAQAHALRADLLATPTLLAARLATLARALDSRVLVAIDQFEEVFTQCASEQDRAAFLGALLSASDDPLDPVRVVFTVRDDFLGHVTGLRALFVIQKLGPSALRRTVTGPLARYRYELDDPSLIDDLMSEVGATEVADLPLLQFACRTLWDGRDSGARKLRRATYTEMGGVAGALAHHAERALAQMTPDERLTARVILLQLVAGTTRRTVARERLVSMLGAAADPVLDKLVATRLLVQRVGDDGTASVEIAHESLLATWGQLARWIDESRDERRLLDELDDAASLWERRGRRVEETWSVGDLAAARHRATQLDLKLPPRIEQFLAAGETRRDRARHRRRIQLGIALAAAAVIGGLAVVYGGRYVAREHAIQLNAGTVDLVLAPYDRGEHGELVPVAASELSKLSWRLYAPSATDPHEPGEPLPDNVVDHVSTNNEGARRVDRLSAPGGTAFLRVDGRGNHGETCAPSWIRLQNLPGYANAEIRRLEIAIPTCQASNWDTVLVDAGEFIYGGPGEPATKHWGEPDYTVPEQKLDLPAFRMDRTEVSNAMFAPFARAEAITGYPKPVYDSDGAHQHDGDPTLPVTAVDAYEAEAYCHYLGKKLPTDHQWVKAARGGLTVHGEPNPAPRRLYTWVGSFRADCINIKAGGSGYGWTWPVGAFACGASPYGILNLLGNAEEWVLTADQPGRSPLGLMRGGHVDDNDEAVTLDIATTVFVNHINPRAFYYSNGFRCVENN